MGRQGSRTIPSLWIRIRTPVGCCGGQSRGFSAVVNAAMGHNARVGRHTGGRAGPESTGRPSSYAESALAWRKVLVLVVLLATTLVAWGVLVHAAIGFGGEARSGRSSGWALLAVATLGAAVCLCVTLLLGARLAALLRERTAPAGPVGGRRARR